jgi:hypothetical protein
MSFEDLHSTIAVEEMKRELQAILGKSNLRLQWRMLEEIEEGEVFERLVVARFKGACVASTYQHQAKPGPLAVTHVSEGTILPFADVYCDRVSAVIQGAIQSESFSRAQTLLGRALGRVLAHELYHIFTRRSRHHVYGVAKSSLTRQDLVEPYRRVVDPASRQIRESLGPRTKAFIPPDADTR